MEPQKNITVTRTNDPKPLRKRKKTKSIPLTVALTACYLALHTICDSFSAILVPEVNLYLVHGYIALVLLYTPSPPLFVPHLVRSNAPLTNEIGQSSKHF